MMGGAPGNSGKDTQPRYAEEEMRIMIKFAKSEKNDSSNRISSQ
jgi:hypothetical protein